MPSQNTIIPISGRMGDHVYYYRKDRKNRKKYFVRRAPATVKQTTATKNSATDFGTASKSSCLIRRALHEYTNYCYDNQLHYNLNREMAGILRADIHRPAGQRRFTAGNLQSLKGFRFNSAANIQINPAIEQNDNGDINISFPDSFNHRNNTTHLSVKAIGLLVNFEKNTTQQVESNRVIIRPGEKCPPLTMNINRRSITLLILEIQSWYEVNGQLYPSQNKQVNALELIAVLTPIEEPKNKRKYRNKAPHFWLPCITPPKPALIIMPVSDHSLHPPPSLASDNH